LAKYLNDAPSVIGGKGAREVISTASLDLQNLGKRLNAIKDEEKVKLDQVLQEKTKEYNDSLLSAERELVERLEKQEDDWKSLFDNERKQLIEAYKEKLNGELEVQKELIEQRLKEEVISKGIELQRDWLAQVKSRVEEERNGRLGKLENLQGEIENLSKTTLGSADWLNENREINKLWTAIRSAWKASVDADSPVPAAFNKELSALVNVAKSSSSSSSSSSFSDDQVISNVISTIPPTIASEGVETLSVLSTWFNSRLSPKILKASFFPQNGGFISYLSSSFLSLFLFKGNTEIGFVNGDDVVSVLSRAQAYLLNRDLDSAVREINQLNGWPKILARDWLVAARKHLEVRQALQIVEAEASLKTLLIL
jgi:mitofilin